MNIVQHEWRSLHPNPPTCKQKKLLACKQELFLVENKGWIRGQSQNPRGKSQQPLRTSSRENNWVPSRELSLLLELEEMAINSQLISKFLWTVVCIVFFIFLFTNWHVYCDPALPFTQLHDEYVKGKVTCLQMRKCTWEIASKMLHLRNFIHTWWEDLLLQTSALIKYLWEYLNILHIEEECGGHCGPRVNCGSWSPSIDLFPPCVNTHT